MEQLKLYQLDSPTSKAAMDILVLNRQYANLTSQYLAILRLLQNMQDSYKQNLIDLLKQGVSQLEEILNECCTSITEQLNQIQNVDLDNIKTQLDDIQQTDIQNLKDAITMAQNTLNNIYNQPQNRFLTTGTTTMDSSANAIYYTISNNNDYIANIRVTIFVYPGGGKAVIYSAVQTIPPAEAVAVTLTAADFTSGVLPSLYEIQFDNVFKGNYIWLSALTTEDVSSGNFIAANTFRYSELVPLYELLSQES